MEDKNISRRSVLLAGAASIVKNIFIKEKAFAKQVEKHKKPKPGEKVYQKEANFDIFPEKIYFLPQDINRRLVIASTTWQTAAFYEKDGSLKKLPNGELLNFLIGTGSNESPTGTGLHEVLYRLGEDYKSNTYPKPDGGASMPNAIALGEVSNMLDDGVIVSRKYDGTALHYSDSISEDKKGKYTIARASHGCLRLGLDISEFFYDNLISKNDDMDNADLVLIIEDKIPEFSTLKEIFAFYYFINMKKRGRIPFTFKK